VAADVDERFAACPACRPAVEALLQHSGAIDLGWIPVPAPPLPPADYVAFGERREYAVVSHLGDLAGPTSGVVRLPHHLDWSGTPVYDLDNPAALGHLYEVVLREASEARDLCAWLDADVLLRLWPQLFIPPKVRRLWEERFPHLAQARTAAHTA
jgi:hypothetical protein